MAEVSQFQLAREYTGGCGEEFYISGRMQLQLLQWNGLAPDSNVLEIGCGCLVAGLPIMRFLNPDRYVGIEPNTWLVTAVRQGLEGAEATISEKRPVFLDNKEFDASSTGRKFDFVISHSVLSHAAYWQLPQFLRNIKNVLAPGAVVLASIRIIGQHGDVLGDSNSPDWVYPDISTFSWERVQQAAADWGFTVELRRDYRDAFVAESPNHHHDWILLRQK